METYHVIVKGRVQGVYFRNYTQEQALRLNLKGWVRNCPDGSVECVLTGNEPEITHMIEWFWQGSPLSNVTDVTARKISTDSSLPSFEVRR